MDKFKRQSIFGVLGVLSVLIRAGAGLALAIPAAFTILVPVTFMSCSSSQINDSDPGSLFKDAEDEIQSEHYQLAIDKLRIIKNKFPYSKFAIDAQLRIADVYFLQESFAEAAASYEAFRELHPKHPKAPYAMYRAAKSYYNDMPSTVARDMTAARKALDTYNDFLRRYPTSSDVDAARKEVADIRRLLAEKELYIADFYYNRDFYDSAKPRYKKTVELYPETDAAKKAQEKLDKIDKMEPQQTK